MEVPAWLLATRRLTLQRSPNSSDHSGSKRQGPQDVPVTPPHYTPPHYTTPRLEWQETGSLHSLNLNGKPHSQGKGGPQKPLRGQSHPTPHSHQPTHVSTAGQTLTRDVLLPPARHPRPASPAQGQLQRALRSALVLRLCKMVSGSEDADQTPQENRQQTGGGGLQTRHLTA